MYASREDYYHVVEISLSADGKISSNKLKTLQHKGKAEEFMKICKQLKPKSRFMIEHEFEIDLV